MKAIPPPSTIKQITHINGVAIVAREPAQGQHPRWPDRQTTFQGISKVLLENDTEATICDDCGFTGEDTRNVVSHRNGTHNRTGPPPKQYSDEVLRALIREVERSRRASGNNVKYDGVKVAAIMNALGHSRADGQPWDAQNVSRVYRHYRDRYKVRLSRPRPQPEPAPRNEGAPEPRVQPTADPLEFLQSIDISLRAMSEAVALMIDKVRASAPDPELADKAARWDQMQALMFKQPPA